MKKIICILLTTILLWASSAFSQTLDATWNPSVGAFGYTLHWGTESRYYTDYAVTYDTLIQVPFSRFKRERTYFFAVTAFNDYESDFSNEISFFIPTGVEEVVLDFKECDEVKSYNILGKQVVFDRAKLPTGVYIHVCWLGNKIAWIKKEGLLK